MTRRDRSNTNPTESARRGRHSPTRDEIRAQFDRFTPPGGVEEFPPEVARRAAAVLAWWNDHTDPAAR